MPIKVKEVHIEIVLPCGCLHHMDAYRTRTTSHRMKITAKDIGHVCGCSRAIPPWTIFLSGCISYATFKQHEQLGLFTDESEEEPCQDSTSAE